VAACGLETFFLLGKPETGPREQGDGSWEEEVGGRRDKDEREREEEKLVGKEKKY